MSGEDEEVQTEVWKSVVPVEFVMATMDASDEPPPPQYRLVPRLAYLPHHLGDVKSYFGQHAQADGSDQFWISYNNEPLQWHLPMGVIYDIILAKQAVKEIQTLRLTVHFQMFPYGKIKALKDDKSVTDHFMQGIKQSFCIRYGTTKAVTNLLPAEENKLRSSVKEFNRPLYNEACGNFADEVSNEYPVLVYKVSPEKPFEYAVVLRAANKESTLGSFLNTIDPTLNLSPDSPEVAGNERVQVLVHGSNPSCNMPMSALAGSAAYLDTFIHIVMCARGEGGPASE